MTDWRPIETAPKGLLLLYYPAAVTGAHGQIIHSARIIVGLADDTPNRPPSHWMPLPQPPEASHG